MHVINSVKEAPWGTDSANIFIVLSIWDFSVDGFVFLHRENPIEIWGDICCEWGLGDLGNKQILYTNPTMLLRNHRFCNGIKIYIYYEMILTLYVLNFSEGTLTYICILCHFSTLIWHRYLKSFPKQDQDLHILHSQYHGCWCSGDVRSQGISSHDIDLVKSS